MTEVRTEILRASELHEKVTARIYAMRNEEELAAQRKALERYEKARKGGQEYTWKKNGRQIRGYWAKTPPTGLEWEKAPMDGNGKHGILVIRPKVTDLSKVNPYWYMPYARYGSWTSHASHNGVLANSRYNRDISPSRVDDFAGEMREGHWRDLLSDPISITADGQVINGQHRLAAIARVDWSQVENDPLFMVIWGVDPQEALHADLSKRTPKEQTVIVSKVAGELIPPPAPATEAEAAEAMNRELAMQAADQLAEKQAARLGV